MLILVGLAISGLLSALGARAFGADGPQMQAWLDGFADSPWGLAAVIGLFVVLAFAGAPQLMLIAAAVAVFGPVRGATYSWVATMISAGLGFGLGRLMAAHRWVTGADPAVRVWMTRIGRHGVAASLLIRLVPLAPFALINMVAGATPMGLTEFLVGTGLGSTPKIAITALGAEGLKLAAGGAGPSAWVLVGTSILAWAALGWLARAWVRRSRRLDR